jgi:O-antigen ligase
MRAGRFALRSDIVGVVLFFTTAIWWTVVSSQDLGSSLGALGLLALVAGCFAAAQVAGRCLSPIVPSAVVVGVAIIAELASGEASGPLGYANADGTLFVLAAFAALMVGSEARNRVVAVAALAAAAVFAVVTVVEGSLAASALLLLGPVVLLAARLMGGRATILMCAAAVLVAIATTAVLGIGYSDTRSAIGSALSERRLALWHDAIVIMERHPADGAGFGGFVELSPTSRSDADARWAHNEFLQAGAETGVPGLILVTVLFLWGFVRLAMNSISRAGALAAAGLAAVGIHASIDYVLHFPAIPMVAAALVGAAAAHGVYREGDQPEREADSYLDQGSWEGRSGTASRQRRAVLR